MGVIYIPLICHPLLLTQRTKWRTAERWDREMKGENAMWKNHATWKILILNTDTLSQKTFIARNLQSLRNCSLLSVCVTAKIYLDWVANRKKCLHKVPYLWQNISSSLSVAVPWFFSLSLSQVSDPGSKWLSAMTAITARSPCLGRSMFWERRIPTVWNVMRASTPTAVRIARSPLAATPG